jgi:peptidoglycan-associated lipoprotein
MKRLLSLLFICALAACSSQVVKTAAPVEDVTPIETPAQEVVMPPASSEVETAPAAVAVLESNPLTDPSNLLSKRGVYFDFDKYNIKPEFSELIAAHAQYLVQHPEISITLEGNADERGSHEYNLSLGQKRAVSVKQALNVLGVSDTQLETISYGEEKPAVVGHDETAWKFNRRTDIKYSGER